METSRQVVVVGAGVIGLTSALRLLQEGYLVTVVADRFTGITSKSAPAAFRPTKLGEIPVERLVRWGRASHAFFTRLFREAGNKAGLTMLTTIEPFRKDLFDAVGGVEVLSQVCPDFREATTEELAAWCPDGGNGWRGGVYSSFTIEGSKLLPFLLERIQELGGTIVQATVSGVPQSSEWCESAALAAGRPRARVIVNCCGLRGGEDCVALRGTLVFVKAPWLRWSVCNYNTEDKEKPTWIVPRESCVVLGSSKLFGGKEAMRDGEEDEIAQDIVERCAEFIPSLRDAPVIGTATCVRPNRLVGARVDRVRVGSYHCVSNYGHGTVGATFSWGCACEVAELVQAGMQAQQDERHAEALFQQSWHKPRHFLAPNMTADVATRSTALREQVLNRARL